MDLDPGRPLRGASPDGLLHFPGTTRTADGRHSAQAPAHCHRGRKPCPERARSWIESAASWLPPEIESTLLLLVCELVNNAVRHGGAGEEEVIELELGSLDGGRVMVR